MEYKSRNEYQRRWKRNIVIFTCEISRSSLGSSTNYVMEWIHDFDDLTAQQNAFCQLLIEVVNRNNPNDFAFAEWIAELYFTDATSRFFGMTAQEIIQRIYKILQIIPPRPINGNPGFPFWDFVPNGWNPSPS